MIRMRAPSIRAGTPGAIIEKVNADINHAMQDANVISGYEKSGMTAKPMSTAEFSRFVREEMAIYAKTAKQANIVPQ